VATDPDAPLMAVAPHAVGGTFVPTDRGGCAVAVKPVPTPLHLIFHTFHREVVGVRVAMGIFLEALILLEQRLERATGGNAES